MKSLIKNLSALLLLLFVVPELSAATVNSIKVYSKAMDKEIDCQVILPDSYSNGEALPVVYLLHGYSGNSTSWVKSPGTTELADQYSVIIVSPDGGFSSWYWDSPIDSSMKYETFTAKELVEYIDANYRTIADRSARAISGLSMGGQGALYLSIRHQDTFGAAGSMSGGVDIRNFPANWHMSKRLGTMEEHPENWEEFTVMNQLDLLKPDGKLAITFDCGVDDFFYEVNNALHEELVKRGIPHRYTTAPGAHTLKYWKESIHYHMLFFDRFFNKK